MIVRTVALSTFALALALSLAAIARAQGGPPDFVGNCQKAAAAKAHVDASTVKVRGKAKGQNGQINVDFVLADGRHGVCRAKADASVDEVKLEGDK